MATTIGNWNVSLGLAAGGFVDGANLARNEVTKLNRTMQSLVTPAERVAKQLDFLQQEHVKSAVDADVHAEAVKRLQAKLDALRAPNLPKMSNILPPVVKGPALGGIIDAQVVERTGRFHGALNQVDATANQVTNRLLGVAAAAASFNTVRDAAQSVVDRVRILDGGLKKAAAIGVNFNDLQRFVYMADNIANIDSGAAVNMLTRLTRNVGEASLAGDKAGKHFKELGLSVSQLNAMSATQQFDAVVEAIRKVESPSERAAYAVKFFGKEGVGLVPMLTASNIELESASDRFDELTYSISAIDAENIAVAADAMGDLSRATDSVKSKLAAELSPTMTAMANDMTDQAISFREGSVDIRGLGFAFKFVTDGVRNMLLQTPGTKLFFDILKTGSQFAAPFADQQAEAQRAASLDEKLKASHAKLQAGAEKPTGTGLDATAVAEQTDEVDRQAKALEHQIRVMELGESAARQIELAEAGVSDADIERIIALEQQLELLKLQEKAAEDIAKAEKEAEEKVVREREQQVKEVERQAEQLEKSVQSPIDTLADKLDELNYLFDVEGAITRQTFDAARQQLLEGATKDMKLDQPKSMEVGSAEAYKFITGLQSDKDSELIKKAEEQRLLAQAQLRSSERMEKHLIDLKDVSPRKVR